MLKVIHAVNTIKELKAVPREFGVEVDIRNDGKSLILHHDPFEKGEPFRDFCRNYSHKLLVLNVKTEGIEREVLRVLRENGIKEYFFLDITFPTILSLSSEGERNIAVRFSEFEPIENAIRMKGRVKWVWIDTFTKLPLAKIDFRKIREAGFRTFLVSPERWGRPDDIEKYLQMLRKDGIEIDAVMTSLGLAGKWD